jgi:hypothetical protein
VRRLVRGPLPVALVAVLAACATSPVATTAPPLPSVTDPARPSPTPRPSPAGTPLPSGVAWLRAPGEDHPPLQPGTYWFNGYEPWLEVTVGAGWQVGHFHDDFFDLFFEGDFPSIGFGRFARVKHRDGTTFEATDARSVVDALRSNPELEVTDVGPATIAGLTGRTIDIRAKSPQTPLFATPDGDFKFDPEFIGRWHILDVAGGALEILVAARPGKLDAAIATTQPVLDSLRLVGL